MTDPVRWGVIGCADIAVKKVIPAMSGSELSHVTAIASRSAERARDTADSLGIPTSYGSYDELLADREIEAVYIPLPNHLHPEWSIAAAEAGKHVLCEKPLATSTELAAEMIDAADRSGVKLMEAFMYRLHPLWAEVRRLIADGAIGELRAVQSFFSYHNVDPSDIRNRVNAGGGALHDIGCYPVNVARMLFDSEPSDVSATIHRDPEFGTDVLTSVMLDFDGRHAAFTCSTQLEDDQRVHIYGTEGRLLVEIPFNIPPDRPTRVLLVSGGDPPVEPNVVVHQVAAADQYRIQADAFSRAIRDDTPVPTPPQDAVGNIEVMERIFADAAART
ncbi:MAG TPA: Gfo/Idh/MocA family oxidoreductase [Acidimicrobiia bacterium]|nr:Gfo/Idh/MocA family oxidoreductase [Acidimicrobiia bacterium]